MRRSVLFALAVLLFTGPSSIAGTRQQLQQLTIKIENHTDGGCLATLDGKTFDVHDDDALNAALAPYQPHKVEVHLIGDMNVPYRCIGGLIYALQRWGADKVGFIAKPPE